MSVGKRKWRMRWWMWLVLAFLVMRYSTLLLPGVSIYYSDDGPTPIDYLRGENQHMKEGTISPGGYTIETARIVRDAGYRIEFYWWRRGRGPTYCVSVTPKWPRTVIYLDANADIDYSKGTDADRLERCPNMTADM